MPLSGSDMNGVRGRDVAVTGDHNRKRTHAFEPRGEPLEKCRPHMLDDKDWQWEIRAEPAQKFHECRGAPSRADDSHHRVTAVPMGPVRRAIHAVTPYPMPVLPHELDLAHD